MDTYAPRSSVRSSPTTPGSGPRPALGDPAFFAAEFEGGWDDEHSAMPGSGSTHALCLWLPTFELRLELVRSPELDSTSVALLTPGEGTRKTVWQVSQRAAESGVRPEMLVSHALTLCPDLTFLEPDPNHYDMAQEQILEVLSQVTPVVEPAGRGRIFLGMDGLERIYGPPRQQAIHALRTLLEVLPRPLVAATRSGWAPGKFGAWVAAVYSRPGDPVVVRREELSHFLAHCPITALPIDPANTQRLKRLAIRELGDLSALPDSALIQQFGTEGTRARSWARGERIDPVRPRHRPQPIRASLTFPSPVGQSDTLHGALNRLLERALARPERRGRSVQGVKLAGHLEGGGSWSIEVTLKEATGDRERIAFTLRAKMALTPPARAVETLAVEIFQFGPATSQSDLFARQEKESREKNGGLSEGTVPEALREAVRELRLRIGQAPLYRVVEIDPWSRIPERRHALLHFTPDEGSASDTAPPSPEAPDGPTAPTLRSLNEAHPVEVRTDPQGFPVSLKRDQGSPRRVLTVRERWRIDDEWWRDPIRREYHTLVLEDGGLVQVYRDLRENRWHLHTSAH